MMDPAPLRVERGQLIEAAHIQTIEQRIAERTYVPGRGCLMTSVPGIGKVIEAERPRAVTWSHPWKPRLLAGGIVLAPGLVNSMLPWAGRDLRPMDGLDPNGERDSRGVPRVEIDPALYTEQGWSWIVLRARINPSTGLLLSPEEGGLQIVQTNRATWLDGAAVDVDGTGDWPLVILRRRRSDRNGLGEAFAHAMFNLTHRYVAGSGGGRHWFF